MQASLDKGFGVAVIVFEVSADGSAQFAGAAMNAAAQLFFGEQCKPALDQVEPGAAGGCEVQMEAGMAQQPPARPTLRWGSGWLPAKRVSRSASPPLPRAPGPSVAPQIIVSVSSLWLPDEAKIETEQKVDGMDDGAATADLSSDFHFISELAL